MTALPPPSALPERAGPIDAATLAEIRAANAPVVIRDAVQDWPLVAAGRAGAGAAIAYLKRAPSAKPVGAIMARPEEGGRFFYNAAMTGMNFAKAQGRLEMFLDDLLHAASIANPPAMAVQSEIIPDVLPHLAAENRLPPLGPAIDRVAPRIWIGNRITVAPHYDVMENLAVCVTGRRRFTLFPPEQIANLYPGPIELTPAGTPVSVVDTRKPDLQRFPRFAAAWDAAQQATLEPGDAIYIPYCWWHGVESLESVNILVNYWWTQGVPEGTGAAYDAMLHALYAIKPLPPHMRAIWRTWFDHFVFETGGDPVAHLPPQARGMLGPVTPSLLERMRRILRQALSK
ncbi:cupin-like domain-containing protein [Altererythrobacter lauratis]|uniref:Cupin-like domain-containing protein n=1 Tax=Alteraurantiacibacter lauratis TaxID=2054627 RepID=A0ABV7EIC0_9SPHN